MIQVDRDVPERNLFPSDLRVSHRRFWGFSRPFEGPLVCPLLYTPFGVAHHGIIRQGPVRQYSLISAGN